MTNIFQNLSVSSEGIICVSDVIIGVSVYFIVIGIAAQVRTKLFVRREEQIATGTPFHITPVQRRDGAELVA